MMNEESVLEPNSIIGQANEAIRVLHEANARLEASGVPMTAFIEDNTLVTRGINLLKQIRDAILKQVKNVDVEIMFKR